MFKILKEHFQHNERRATEKITNRHSVLKEQYFVMNNIG